MTYINYIRYKITLEKDYSVRIEPLAYSGDVASSNIPRDDLQYVNGGQSFKAAVDLAQAVAKLIKSIRAGAKEIETKTTQE